MAEENTATSQTIENTSTSQIVGRQELIKYIAQETQLSQKQVAEVLEAILRFIREKLQDRKVVRFVGFGSFKVLPSAARSGVNPRNREPIQIPSKDRVRFFPGKELAEAVLKK